MAANPDTERYDVLAQSERTRAIQSQLARGRGPAHDCGAIVNASFAFPYPPNKCMSIPENLETARGNGSR